MKKTALLCLLATLSITANKSKSKKKIIILTSTGGGGQVSFNKALTQTLKDDYAVKSELYFSSILNAVDPVSLITFGNYTGEDAYNYFLKKRSFFFLQTTYELSRWYYRLFSSTLIKKTTAFLEKEKPDLVISIIPIVNDAIAKSCKSLNIPFLIAPPDLDVSFYTKDMRPPYSKDFYIGLPFDNQMSRESMALSCIPTSNIFSFQYPLRHDFYEKKDINAIKKMYNITDTRPVVLLMMGAQGGVGSYTFSKELVKYKDPAHILICIGKNEDMRKTLQTMSFPKHLTPHIIGYTEQISDLMAISDVMISKTGAISTIEALYSNLPIIADQTEYVLSWELFHQKFLEKNNCGLILKKISELAPLVTQLLNNSTLLNTIKSNITNIISKQPKQGIQHIVEKILKSAPNKKSGA